MSRFEEVVNEAIGQVVLGEVTFKVETLAEHIAQLVRDRQGARRAEVTVHARFPEYKPAPVSGIQTQELYTLHGSRDLHRARHPPADRRHRPGHDRVPVRAGTGRRRGARAARRRRASTATRSSGSSQAVPSRRTTSAASARCTSACTEQCDAEIDAAILLEIAEQSMSSEIYELMKRSDEAYVVEKAHRRPRFVEDCVREMVKGVVEAFPGSRGQRVRVRAPGEPRDDPPAQRDRRAVRDAWRDPPGDRDRRRLTGAHEPSGLARRDA